ncbi:calmodulin [Plakobranchus ocellatus]|uniref:Calmodulin n=1 Tax=Plakobranchus ocellatus TaxID=259542 RepID=A0AAV4CTU2_9GAST|nr:calmodulin [Plakobranchus ocellatus]
MAQITQEQRDEIREAFGMFDKNGDGHISVAEIKEVMRAFGQNPTEAEAKQMIEEIDDNNNGFIDYPEFEAMMLKKGLKTREEEEEEMKNAFKVFDRNGDGYVSTSELRETMASLGEPLTQEELEDMISEADKNNDGRIDYLEFAKVMAR